MKAEHSEPPRTIDYHLRKVFQKLNTGSSRTELVRLALAEGLGTADSSPENVRA